MHACVRKELIERENKNKKRINTQENQPNLYFIHFHFRQISGQLCHEEVSAMNDPSPDLIKDANVHRLLNESHLSYRELFRRLDKNHDGKIYADQLIELLEKVGVETSTKNRWTIARRIIDQAGGLPNASSLSFKQFVSYVLKQEKKLSLVFRKLDASHQGKFDAKDLVYYFQKLGIQLDLDEADRLVGKMDQDNSLEISFDEWRSFFLFNPAILESVTGDPNEMLRYWRGATHLDLGEPSYVAPEDAETENIHWWKNLVAGGCAGAVSRTATAPFDRLKIIMQV
jgi:solute carrier family 25 phosphate transporter 23/24/25/41